MDDRSFPTANDPMINQQAWENLPNIIAIRIRRFKVFSKEPLAPFVSSIARLGWLRDLSENPAVRVALTRYYPIQHHGILELVMPAKAEDDGKRLITLFPLTQDMLRVSYEILWNKRWSGSHIRKGCRLGQCNTAALPEMLRQTEKAIDRLIAVTAPDHERQSL